MTCSCESADSTIKVMKSRRIDQYLEMLFGENVFRRSSREYKPKYANLCKRIIY